MIGADQTPDPGPARWSPSPGHVPQHAQPEPAGPRPASPVTGIPWTAGPLARRATPRQLDRLRVLVRCQPGAAVQTLCTTGAGDDATRLTLLAEASVRLGYLRFATVCARRAVRRAESEHPVDPRRILPAAAVLADTTILLADTPAARLAGGPNGLACARWLRELARWAGDPQRTLMAEVLSAVACYQRDDCHQAGLHLRQLRDRYRADGDYRLADLLQDTREALTHACDHATTPQPPATPHLVAQGGLVEPEVSITVLTDRWLQHLWHHCCPGRLATPS